MCGNSINSKIIWQHVLSAWLTVSTAGYIPVVNIYNRVRRIGDTYSCCDWCSISCLTHNWCSVESTSTRCRRRNTSSLLSISTWTSSTCLSTYWAASAEYAVDKCHLTTSDGSNTKPNNSNNNNIFLLCCAVVSSRVLFFVSVVTGSQHYRVLELDLQPVAYLRFQ